MASKAVQRSLAHLRKLGWSVCVVERWIPPRGKMPFGVRIDAFGFADLLACRPGFPTTNGEPGRKSEIALIQTTGAPSAGGWFAQHKAKILAIPEFYKWKESGGIVLLHGWRKGPKDGVRGARKVWVLREEVL
jgi:hypothetical protein